jgi:O-antigen ligase
LLHSDPIEDKRLVVWEPIRRLVIEYMPFGTGPGAFVEPYQMREPDALLSPSYLNHAHNDWLETAMTAGLPGLFVLLFAITLFTRTAWAIWRFPADRTTIFARLGTVVIGLLALASVADYPLRVPALMSVVALMASFVANALCVGESRAGRSLGAH